LSQFTRLTDGQTDNFLIEYAAWVVKTCTLTYRSRLEIYKIQTSRFGLVLKF